MDIDLSISAYANSQRYYTQKKSAAIKEQKTIDSSKKVIRDNRHVVYLTIITEVGMNVQVNVQLLLLL